MLMNCSSGHFALVCSTFSIYFCCCYTEHHATFMLLYFIFSVRVMLFYAAVLLAFLVVNTYRQQFLFSLPVIDRVYTSLQTFP